ncbi:MAG TPA: hypothetical protein ENL01_00585 [Chlorobaculum parvum]|uniref:Uncharacterized protein n=1 Tax=Chlorobaculum parvum TaxID=274539 RepID=A0A7C5DBH2_9CHLB|nr:hypothetical protein [Chlorobaculum parvum]
MTEVIKTTSYLTGLGWCKKLKILFYHRAFPDCQAGGLKARRAIGSEAREIRPAEDEKSVCGTRRNKLIRGTMGVALIR